LPRRPIEGLVPDAVVDQLNLEKKGIPTVTFATTELVGLAKSTAFSMGVADMAFVVVPHPMGGIPLPEITQKANDAYPLMVKLPLIGSRL